MYPIFYLLRGDYILYTRDWVRVEGYSEKGVTLSKFPATGVAEVWTAAGFLVGLGFRVLGLEFKIWALKGHYPETKPWTQFWVQGFGKQNMSRKKGNQTLNSKP